MKVGKCHVARLCGIGSTLRPAEARAGGSQRLEAETLQITRGSNIPRIGNEETPGLMQLLEGAPLSGNTRSSFVHAKCSWRSSRSSILRQIRHGHPRSAA